MQRLLPVLFLHSQAVRRGTWVGLVLLCHLTIGCVVPSRLVADEQHNRMFVFTYEEAFDPDPFKIVLIDPQPVVESRLLLFRIITANIVEPDGDDLSIKWFLNDVAISENTAALQFDPCLQLKGLETVTHRLEVVVADRVFQGNPSEKKVAEGGFQVRAFWILQFIPGTTCTP